MEQPSYRYELCDLLTDRRLATLPLSGVSFERRISRVGPISGTLTAADPESVRVAKLVRANAGRAALYAYRGNQLWWGGVLWTANPSQGERGAVTLGVQGATFDSYAHRRVLREYLDLRGVDQGVIIPYLWRHLQSDPRGDIGVAAEDQPTGKNRDREYQAGDLHRYGKLIEQLGDVEDGPEHTIDVYEQGGVRVKRLRVADRLGVAEPRFVFSRAGQGTGGGVVSWEETADATEGGTTFQTRGDATAANVGAEQQPRLSSVQEATALLDAGWPLLDVTADHSGVKEQATLEEHAAALAEAYAGAIRTSGYTVRVGDTGWSPNRLGDTVRLKLDDLWHDGADITVRPVGCKVTAAEKGKPETVTLLFGGDD